MNPMIGESNDQTADKPAEKGGRVRGSTIILSCTCLSWFQDSLYGSQMRVHNVARGTMSARGTRGDLGRCTVCGRERGLK